MSIFELTMLLCFGASWPFAISKTYQTKNVKGTSPIFLFLLLLGYVCGILHKIIFNFDFVILFYFINGSMVLTELILYYRYRGNN